MDLSSTILEVGHKVRPVVGKIVPQFIIDIIYAKVTIYLITNTKIF